MLDPYPKLNLFVRIRLYKIIKHPSFKIYFVFVLPITSTAQVLPWNDTSGQFKKERKNSQRIRPKALCARHAMKPTIILTRLRL